MAGNQHVVLYVPGLGDRNLSGRQSLLRFWSYRSVSIEICPMNWTVDEAWQTKLSRLIDWISHYHDEGRQVSIVGESAGATAVIQALQLQPDKLKAVILLCGKSQYPNRVAQYRYKQNPALYDALVGSDAAVHKLTEMHKQKILNLHPLFDPVVPVPETKISGVKNSTMPMIGHATSIVFANTLWSWRIVRFIKKQR